LGFVDKNFSERSLHFKFKEYRIRGEWFEPSEEIVGFISENKIKATSIPKTKPKKREPRGDKSTQREVAMRLKINEWSLSRYIRGVSRPKLEEADRLVKLAPETNVMMWLKKDYRNLKKALGL
jgi:hypothetical protein